MASIRCGSRSKAPLRPAFLREQHGQQVAREPVVGTAGVNLQHLDVILEGGPLLDDVEAEGPAAGDFQGQSRHAGGVESRGSTGRRPSQAAARRGRAFGLAHVEVEPLHRADLEVFQAADVRAGLIVAAAFAGHQPHVHRPAAAEVRPQAEVDRLRRRDIQLAHLHVARRHQQAVLAVGRFAAAANGHRAGQLAARNCPGFNCDRSKPGRTGNRRRRALPARSSGLSRRPGSSAPSGVKMIVRGWMCTRPLPWLS